MCVLCKTSKMAATTWSCFLPKWMAEFSYFHGLFCGWYPRSIDDTHCSKNGILVQKSIFLAKLYCITLFEFLRQILKICKIQNSNFWIKMEVLNSVSKCHNFSKRYCNFSWITFFLLHTPTHYASRSLRHTRHCFLMTEFVFSFSLKGNFHLFFPATNLSKVKNGKIDFWLFQVYFPIDENC